MVRKMEIQDAKKSGLLNGRPIREVYYDRYLRYTEKRRGIKFLMSREKFDELWAQPCSYCGARIETIGIDRLNSSGDYTDDNVVPCCPTCNKMKLTMTVEQFVKKCAKIAERAGFKWVLRR